jgi:hypothetical protein
MSNKERPPYVYKKSFLIVWHILLGGVFIWYTIMIITGYTKNIMLGTTLSIAIAIGYIMVLRISAKHFNEQNIGAAYFLTITGFLVGVFVQIMTCSNSIDPIMMH